MKKFDLNIEKILEDWTVADAIREIIANVLDEKKITSSRDIQIFKNKECWHIKDFGRGLNYTHFTQKENDEKLNRSDITGKFGVGLKDALATFDRHNIKILIKSKYGEMTLGKSSKSNFKDIVTLHIFINDPKDKNFVGTEFILKGVKDEDIKLAKDFFLKYSNEKLLEKTKYGWVLERKKDEPARIYINGVKVAKEDSFLFSYNITNITKKIKSALNRERTNVGRSAYTDSIKSILLACKSDNIIEKLAEDLEKFAVGNEHDELKWTDIKLHAIKIINSKKNVVMVTKSQLENNSDLISHARNDGLDIVLIPENIGDKIHNEEDIEGKPIMDLNQFSDEWGKSFKYKFIDPKKLTKKEKEIFKMTNKILSLIGGKPPNVKEILISETMRPDIYTTDASGVWEENKNRIIIKRDQLSDLSKYAGTLLHEISHATSGASDISEEFEHELTNFLGIISKKALKK